MQDKDEVATARGRRRSPARDSPDADKPER